MAKKLGLALQGGGSHGAFTWGVIERLLEDDRIEITSLCGTSAGAMNAVIVAYGMQLGGKEGAIKLLNKFWRKIADQQKFSLLQPSFLDKFMGGGKLSYSPMYHLLDFYTMVFSPYQFNVLNYNPLKDLLLELINFEKLKTFKGTKLFLCATNVRTSRAKVFDLKEASVDAVLASACLPFLFKAVEIDGEAYWDGGYMGNPPIFPLIDDVNTTDILLIQINPIKVKDIPKTADEIRDRINALSFNSSLMHEMRRLNMVQKLLEVGLNSGGKLRKINIHNINPEEMMASLSASSKLNTEWQFLQELKKWGKESADKWLQENYQKIGKESSCDLREVFL